MDASYWSRLHSRQIPAVIVIPYSKKYRSFPCLRMATEKCSCSCANLKNYTYIPCTILVHCVKNLCLWCYWFTGPGPGRYALPTGVGYVKHDLSKKVYPAYSFGQKLSDLSKWLKYLQWNLFNPKSHNNLAYCLLPNRWLFLCYTIPLTWHPY